MLQKALSVTLTGTAGSQAIALVASLALTRLYAPAAFGAYAVWLSIAAVGAILATARLETSLALSADGPQRATAVRVVLATLIAGSVSIGLAVIAVATVVPQKLPLPFSLAALLPAGIALTASAQSLLSFGSASGLFAVSSAQRLTHSATVALAQLTAALVSASALSLALGYVVGALAACVLAARAVGRKERVLWEFPTSAEIVGFWRSHWRFPVIALPADLTNSLAIQLPVVLLAADFGAAASGAYALAYRSLGVPLAVIGTAVLDVFRRTAGQRYRDEGHCRPEYLRTLRLLLPGACAVAIGGVAFAKPVFALAFGAEWERAGEFARILTPLFAMRLLASPLSYTFYLARAQHVDLIWQVALLAMTVATLRSGATPEEAIRSYALGYTCLYVVYVFLAYRMSGPRRSGDSGYAPNSERTRDGSK